MEADGYVTGIDVGGMGEFTTICIREGDSPILYVVARVEFGEGEEELLARAQRIARCLSRPIHKSQDRDSEGSQRAAQ